VRFGLHLSISGRLANAAVHGKALGCQALQIFPGNPRGWEKAPFDPAQVAEFRTTVKSAQLDPVVVHATYLINLAAPDADIYKKSCTTFFDELERTASLGAAFYVIHSGSHKGTGEVPARARIQAALKEAQACGLTGKPGQPMVLFENTAGTANSLGTTFEDLAALLDGPGLPDAGVCFDTCHALAAGYEIRTKDGVTETLTKFDKSVGLKRLRCLHVNDSKGALGSRIDRHEHIGEGELGAKGFAAFLADERVWNLPAILETPQDESDDCRRNLRRIVELACAAGALSTAARDLVSAKPEAPATPASKKKVAKKSAPKAIPKVKAKSAKAAPARTKGKKAR